MDIELGSRVQDKITGFKGVVMAIADYHWCRRALVAPSSEDDSSHSGSRWFDVICLDADGGDEAGSRAGPPQGWAVLG